MIDQQDRQRRLDAAQWDGVNAWLRPPNMGRGTLEWHTGVGKTHSVVKAYPRFRAKFDSDDDNIIIVVPTLILKNAWEAHAIKWGWTKVEVFVINSYVTELHKCKWLIIDECHRVLSEDAETFNKTIDVSTYDFCLCLSATLTPEEKYILQKRGLPVVHTISEAEARAEGFTSDYIEYNLEVKLNHIEQKTYDTASKMHDSNMRFFVIDNKFEFNIAMACMANIQRCKEVARYRGWNPDKGEQDEDSPSNIKKAAVLWNKGMSDRKNLLYGCKAKIDTAVAIIRKFPKKRIITFSMNSEVADAITLAIGDKARSYHTNLKGEIREGEQTSLFAKAKPKKIGVKKLKEETLTLFEKGEVTTVNSVKALDEGFDSVSIDMSIIIAASSKGRQQKQRKGRSTRFDRENENKKTIIVNLYVKGTQDEKWLKERQENSKDVHWISSIDEIDETTPTESEDFNINTRRSNRF